MIQAVIWKRVCIILYICTINRKKKPRPFLDKIVSCKICTRFPGHLHYHNYKAGRYLCQDALHMRVLWTRPLFAIFFFIFYFAVSSHSKLHYFQIQISIAFRIRMILCNNKGNCHNLYHRLPAEATTTCTKLC